MTALLALSCICLTGCQTNTQTGALAGASIGAIGGALITGSGSGALIGAGIGAASGALIGYGLDEQDQKALSQQSPSTLDKIQKGEPLTISDIKQMVTAGISDDVIISQIEATHTLFSLSTADIMSLNQAGVSQKVIQAMIQTSG
ncbi:glycine zipper domain-containing protein [Rhabdochlamydiaceae symbiont of Dictyostelium giganteum]|uniref:glycine zipper domain-containing protein n=1 Tax=Rhabdochlamydiaceae symbiont of Dictyostelium giganteum TaxID=3342349 RepID=UPI003850DD6E